MEKKKSVKNGLRRWVITGGLTAALLLSGCGNEGATASGSRGMVSEVNVANTATSSEMHYDAAAEEPYMGDTADIYKSSGSFDEASGLEIETPETTNRKLIRNVSLEVETQDFQTLITNVTNRVKTLGGYIENSNVYNGSNFSGEAQRYATMTLRIPSAKADTFLAEVADQSNITQQNENVSDVTLEYVDLESHKKVLLAEEENLIELLEATTDIDDMITLENRISNLRYQIESMESQLRTYDNKVDYTTISLHVTEVIELTEIVEPEPEPEEPTTWERISTGFTDNLNRVITTLTDLLVAFLSNLPTLLIWAIIIFVIVKAAKKLIPGLNRKNPAVQPTEEASEGSDPRYKWFNQKTKTDHKENKAENAENSGFHWPDGDDKKNV